MYAQGQGRQQPSRPLSSQGSARQQPSRPVSSQSYHTCQPSQSPAYRQNDGFNREAYKQQQAVIKLQYITTFCEHMARVQRASRPPSILLLKSYYIAYRGDHPVKGISPSSMVFQLKKRKLIFVHYETRLLEWTQTLVNQYGDAEGEVITVRPPERVRPELTIRPTNGASSSTAQHVVPVPSVVVAPKNVMMTKALFSLKNDPREILEQNKNGIEIGDIQDHLRSMIAETEEQDGDRMGDGDGAIFIKCSDKVISRTFAVRNTKFGQKRKLKVYLLVGVEGIGVCLKGIGPGPPPEATEITAASVKFITLSITPRNHGLMEDAIVFDFEDFVIVRYICIRAEEASIQEAVKGAEATSVYRKVHNAKNMPAATRIVRGTPVLKPDFAKLPNILGKYEVPKELRDLMAGAAGDDPFEKEENPFPITPETHFSSFMRLQQVEELQVLIMLQMELDIRKYDLKGVSFRKTQAGGKLTLVVQGLAERRPSVLYGDKLYVRREGRTDVEYEGYVEDVDKENVVLSFDMAFIETVYMDNMRFDVRFTFSRTPLRRSYQGLQLAAVLPESFKFPTKPPDNALTQRRANPNPVDEESPGIRMMNTEQRMAIRNIVEARHSGAPYIIFGPPGTGKTMCVVECIRQVHNCYRVGIPKTHILVMAPSNLATDQLIERLRDAGFPPSEMFRLNSYQRPIDSVSEAVREYSRLGRLAGRAQFFSLPNAREIMGYSVVVTTCISAGLLYSMGIPKGHFSHIFVDEAGQATEPEFWIGVAGLIDRDPKKGQIILAGDPQQLGPILRSTITKRYGLETSFLERLVQLPVYALETDPTRASAQLEASQTYKNPTMITKELLVCADEAMRTAFDDWSELPAKGFPIIIHGVNGKDQQEGDSPSWFNPDEVGMVRRWCEKLRAARGKGVTLNQIGIITPFRRQVQKIEASLRPLGGGPKVASVEEFQGQERRIIIISVVRSSPAYIQHDLLHSLGFLKNPKRFNVAVSRAKALMIVVGNPVIMAQDDWWGALLRHCRQKGAVIGYDPDGRGTAGVPGADGSVTSLFGTVARMRMAGERTRQEEEMTALEGETDGTGVGAITAAEDPEWSYRG
ncbi:hypothetical protein HK101_008328 [Irineochytrium annulatum]|nr:hypothetical protein HK101_008328 [Irineochytrium annulatum]